MSIVKNAFIQEYTRYKVFQPWAEESKVMFWSQLCVTVLHCFTVTLLYKDGNSVTVLQRCVTPEQDRKQFR